MPTDTPLDLAPLEAHASPAGSGWRRVASRLSLPFLLGGGGALIVGYLSIIVLLPIAAIISHGLSISVAGHGAGLEFWRWHVSINLSLFWDSITAPGAENAIFLSLWLSFAVAAINAVMGVAIAWVIVRDRFFGRTFIDSVIDLPFALPTIVAGGGFLSIYGTGRPTHPHPLPTR